MNYTQINSSILGEECRLISYNNQIYDLGMTGTPIQISTPYGA